jgi:hypothetical protein
VKHVKAIYVAYLVLIAAGIAYCFVLAFAGR